MMIGSAIESLDVHVGLRAAGKAFEKIKHQLRLQIAHPRGS
jgi:hypothetical protein